MGGRVFTGALDQGCRQRVRRGLAAAARAPRASRRHSRVVGQLQHRDRVDEANRGVAVGSSRTITLQGSSRPMSGSADIARRASGGLQAPRMRCAGTAMPSLLRPKKIQGSAAPRRAAARCGVATGGMVAHDSLTCSLWAGRRPSQRDRHRSGNCSSGGLPPRRLVALPTACRSMRRKAKLNVQPGCSAQVKRCDSRGARALGVALCVHDQRTVHTPGTRRCVKCAAEAGCPAERRMVADAPTAVAEHSLPAGQSSSRAPVHMTRKSRRCSGST